MDLTQAKRDFARKAVRAFTAGDEVKARQLFELAQDQGPAAIEESRLEGGAAIRCKELVREAIARRPASENDVHSIEGVPHRSEKYFKDGRPGLVATWDWDRAAKAVLDWIRMQEDGGEFRLDLPFVPTFGHVAIAACCRRQRENPANLCLDYAAQSSRFAQAIGVPNTIESSQPFIAAEADRTVPLGRIAERSQIASMASNMARLVVPDSDGIYLREIVNYSLVELLRNVVQHSCDPLGGVAAAQMIPSEHGSSGQASVQIAVADLGLGIEATLAELHSDVKGDALAAINKAMRPRISGTFREGAVGSFENAGLGLFFLSRITKLLKGRFLIASRGAAISGSGSDEEGHLRQRSLAAEFPGTLVVFEIPREIPEQFRSEQGIVSFIRENELRALAPDKGERIYWIQMVEPDAGTSVHRVLVSVGGGDFKSIRELVEKSILPAINAEVGVALDFLNVKFLTDSMAHELVGMAVREAYQRKVPVYAVNTTTAIARTLVFVQSYLLADLAPLKGRRRGQ
jgi:hypothetical protein